MPSDLASQIDDRDGAMLQVGVVETLGLTGGDQLVPVPDIATLRSIQYGFRYRQSKSS